MIVQRFFLLNIPHQEAIWAAAHTAYHQAHQQQVGPQIFPPQSAQSQSKQS